MNMLSPHEFATLLLVKDAADSIADRTELSALLERQLVALEELASGTMRLCLTADGDMVLEAIGRLH
jgi:hypothetical protein